MASPTEPLFRDNAYLPSCEAVVTDVSEAGGVVLDRTVFYASGGGQPGDIGRIEFGDGTMVVQAIGEADVDVDDTLSISLPAARCHLFDGNGNALTRLNPWQPRASRKAA